MIKLFIMLTFSCILLMGCADIPIKDGELAIGKNTSATLEEAGVARVNNRF